MLEMTMLLLIQLEQNNTSTTVFFRYEIVPKNKGHK